MSLKWLYYGLMFLCAITLILKRNSLNKRHLLFLPIMLLAITTQLVAEVIEKEERDHYFMFHLYIPLEYMLLSVYYYFLLKLNWIKWLLIATNVLFLTFCIVHYFMGENFWLPDFTDFALGGAFTTIFVIAFFFSMFRKDEITLFRFPDFWINAGNLFFYAGCLFVMGLYFSVQQQDQKLANDIMKINNYLNLLLYLCYFIAFVCQPTKLIS